MSGPVWMKFYVGDYLGDTMHLTRDQHGAYLLLIFAYWRNGSLPDDDRLLAGITKSTPEEWRSLRQILTKFFKIRGGFWRQKRIEAELREAENIKKARRAAALSGVAKRQHLLSKRSAIAQQMHSPPLDSPPTHSESESERKEEPPLKAPPTGGQINGAATNGKNGRGQGARLPVDWQPDAADREFAGELGLDAGQVAEQFRDYWQAVPGRKATRLDWHATFRNACRHYATTGAGRSGSGSGRGTHRPAAPGFTAAIRRAFADADDENLG